MSLISIVVPTFNRGDIINETIESIISQTYDNWELIIIDDGSNDNTQYVVEQYIKQDTRIKFYTRPNNRAKGANSCRNFGFEHAKGQYIKWVDSDDILVPNALAIQIALLSSYPNLKVCFAYGRFFNDKTLELEEEWARKNTSEDILWDYIRNNIRWPIGGPMWRKSFFISAPFNENLRNAQEWLMHGKQLINLKTNEYHILKECIYHIRRGNVRMSSSRSSAYFRNSAKARLLLMKEHLRSNNTSIKVTLELIKQVLVYSFHAITKKLKSS